MINSASCFCIFAKALYAYYTANKYLLDARKAIYPELNGIGHSYGVGKFADADRAFDVYQVLRHALGDPREPFQLGEPLRGCTKLE